MKSTYTDIHRWQKNSFVCFAEICAKVSGFEFQVVHISSSLKTHWQRSARFSFFVVPLALVPCVVFFLVCPYFSRPQSSSRSVKCCSRKTIGRYLLAGAFTYILSMKELFAQTLLYPDVTYDLPLNRRQLIVMGKVLSRSCSSTVSVPLLPQHL